MGKATNQAPIYVELKAMATPIAMHQYPMSQEAQEGIWPHINRLLDLRILRSYQSAWNTPLLPIKKTVTQDYRPVQDLREVNWHTLHST